MKAERAGQAEAGGPVLGNTGARAASLPPGMRLDGHPVTLLDFVRDGVFRTVPRRRRQTASSSVPPLERLDFRRPPILETSQPQGAPHMGGPCTVSPAWANLRSWRMDRRLFSRVVSFSGLGWAFVFAAVCWVLFAVIFSQRAGWGSDRGAPFFAWSLGILVLGFCSKRMEERPAVPRLFLGMNLLVVSVLTMVVATRLIN